MIPDLHLRPPAPFSSTELPTRDIALPVEAWLTQFYEGYRTGNIVYICIALLGVIVSNACLAVRLLSIRQSHSMFKLPVIHIIVVAIYTNCSCFCISSCLLFFGNTICSQASCHAALYLVLIFYIGQKSCMYLFMVERAYSIQKQTRPRWKDRMYLSGIIFCAVGFMILSICAFVWNHADYNEEMNDCRIGFRRSISLSFLTWDIFVHIFLTSVFLFRCAPYMDRGYYQTFIAPIIQGTINKLALVKCGIALPSEPESAGISQKVLLKVIRKAVWACFALMPGTLAIFGMMIRVDGHERAWFFLTLTTLDIIWAVTIIHWLTTGPIAVAPTPNAVSNASSMGRSAARTFARPRPAVVRKGSTMSM